MPWIITIGPLSEEEEWEPVVCGPYERAHALALAEEIVADDELMAVVEPVVPHVSVDSIREEIAAARALADEEDDDADTDLVDVELDDQLEDETAGDEPDDDEYDDLDEDEDEDDEDLDEDDDDEDDDEDDEESAGPPTPDEIRAGFARIAARLMER